MPSSTASSRLADRAVAFAGLPQLSRRAVEYGAALALDDAAELAARLYRYNSLPASPAWRRRLSGEAAAARLLGIERGAPSTAAWQVWDADAPPAHAVTFKLYLSPAPAETGDACRALRAQLREPDGPFSVKLARPALALMRPDRLVAYFATRRACLATARRLEPRLRGMRPHGVPFTAAIGRSGLLSWGADPPEDVAAACPAGERSWRGWVTRRLADALVAAREARVTARGDAALAALRRAGVDTVRWTPPWS